jgi:threonine dehydratase
MNFQRNENVSEKLYLKIIATSGSNNDITRTEEIRERSLLFEGLKHHFIIRFPNRPRALGDFVEKCWFVRRLYPF